MAQEGQTKADQPENLAGSSTPPPAAAPKSEPAASNVLETTTSKDTSLPVNQTGDSPSSTAEPESPALINAGSALTSGASAPPEKPIVVSEDEVSSSPTSSEHLAEEIETLSGEIQALEAKIDRLTGNVSAEGAKPEIRTASPVSSETIKITPPAQSAPLPPQPMSTAPKPTAPVTDIYAKVAQRQKEAEQGPSKVTPDFGDAEDIGSFSGVGTIGEVLTVFGLIIFLLMMASPFFKQMLPTNLWEAVRSIGWPTAGVSLLLGFLLLLFAKGKGLLKLMAVIFFLVSALMYVGASGYTNLLGPLAGPLESLFSFYK